MTRRVGSHGETSDAAATTADINSISSNNINIPIGVLPVLLDDDGTPLKAPSSNAATGASAAGVRALTSQAVAFYFRAPVKAFFRTRVDYLAYARALQEQQHALRNAMLTQIHASASHTPLPPPSSWSNAWLWLKVRMRGTTPGVIASAVKYYGWRVVPDQVLPPLIANVGVGAVLYTSYLQILGRLHAESALASKRVYPPPAPTEVFTAGFLAGAIQSVIAAPLDAVQARYDMAASAAGMTGSGNPVLTHMGSGSDGTPKTTTMERPKSMWAFSASKLKEIGVRGIFAGWGLSFLKDSMGCAIFFTTFEYIKAQSYYSFVTWYYGSLNEDTIVLLSQKRPSPASGKINATEDGDSKKRPTIIRPHYAIEPTFLLLAGMSASIAQQVILHPLSHIQVEHWERLEALDEKARKVRQLNSRNLAPTNNTTTPRSDSGRLSSLRTWRWGMLKAYYQAYKTTWAECTAEAVAAKLTMRQWLYRGFWWNTIRQVPSTSAGLIIFELARRKYGLGGDQVRINRDGYDILLN